MLTDDHGSMNCMQCSSALTHCVIFAAELFLSSLSCHDCASLHIAKVRVCSLSPDTALASDTTSVCLQIAGGSGITPMLQVASEIVSNPEDKTQVLLIFANQTEQDIILRDKIDEMAAKHDNFQVLQHDRAFYFEALTLLHCCMQFRRTQWYVPGTVTSSVISL